MIIRYLADMLPYVLIFCAVYCVMRACFSKGKTDIRREASLLFFHAFIIGVISQTVLPLEFVFGKSASFYNFIPFHAVKVTIDSIGTHAFESYFTLNILGNIFLFVPIGFFHRLGCRCGLLKTTMICCAVSCSIEAFQILLYRSTDIDDIILNTVGGLLGGLACGDVNAIIKRAGKRNSASDGKQETQTETL